MGKYGYFDEVLQISMSCSSSLFKAEQSGKNIFPLTFETRTFARRCIMAQKYILQSACHAFIKVFSILNRKHVIARVKLVRKS